MSGRAVRPRSPHLRTVVLLVMLLPTSGLALLVSSEARTAWRTRDLAVEVRDASYELTALLNARVTILDEQIAASTVVIASGLGANIDDLSVFLGIDYRDHLARVRQAVDDDPLLESITSHLLGFDAMRVGVDQGTATLDEVFSLFDRISSALDGSWDLRLAGLQRRVEASTLDGSVHARLTATDESYQALRAGIEELLLMGHILVEVASPADTLALASADERYDIATRRFFERLGPKATAAWQAHRADPAARRFEQLRQRVVRAAIAGTTAELRADLTAYSEAVADGLPWMQSIVHTVQAAEQDLRVESDRQAAEAEERLRTEAGLAAGLSLVAAAGALLVARFVTRPARRLAAAAHEIQQGYFGVEPVATTGPRELAATAGAFNDMASTLAAVEVQAVALAQDPDSPVLSEELPGRVGRAMGVALRRLRAAMRLAEQRRQELEEAATHDGLTGLLNRGAAMAMIERDLSLLTRTGGREMALFIDLDALKSMNDSYGHAAGDDAIRLVGAALRAATRHSDIVARLGGDEFLVAGTVSTADEVDPLADRVLAAVSAQELEVPGGSVPLRCSIGVALSCPDDLSPDPLIGAADTAMYLAKRAGGGRVAWHPDSRPATPSGDVCDQGAQHGEPRSSRGATGMM